MTMKVNLILILTIVILSLSGCKDANQNDQGLGEARYTCPMHPTVVSNTPGSCPVCNMSLVKVEGNMEKHAEGNFITIDKRQQELAGIVVDTVKLRNLTSSSTFLGTVAIDEESIRTISSRVNGRIDKLFVKANGIFIKQGMPLYSIYSEQLQADKKEYLSLLEKTKEGNPSGLFGDLIKASRNKLLLWGLTQDQISDLQRSGTTEPLMTFYSPVGGYVREVNITEGMYVDEGSGLFKIISLDDVWIEAQLYANEVEMVRGQTEFDVFSERDHDKIYSGTLIYKNPGIEEGKRMHLVRIRVENSGGDLIPGMPVYVSPKKSALNVLAIPRTAVLFEKMKTVWVLAHENTFEQRMIETGREDNHWVEVSSGLNKGEIIVSEGGYLISSEFTLKSGATQTHAH